MSRILAIDYGQKRCGIAVTDILQIIPNGLKTVATNELMTFLKDYLSKEDVECIVIGLPKQNSGKDSASCKYINPFISQLHKNFPLLKIERYDERFTSVLAHQTIIESGIGKKARRNKGLVDEISATIILQDYMESNRIKKNYNL